MPLALLRNLLCGDGTWRRDAFDNMKGQAKYSHRTIHSCASQH